MYFQSSIKAESKQINKVEFIVSLKICDSRFTIQLLQSHDVDEKEVKAKQGGV